MEMTYKDIGKGLHIAPSTAHQIFKQFKATGNVDQQKMRCRYDCRKYDMDHEFLLVGLLMENPAMYLHKICNYIEKVSGLRVAASTICRILQRNGYTRKKIQALALERSAEYRGIFQANISHLNANCFVWVDETGTDARSHIRKFGYSLKGITPTCHKFLARGRRISAIAAISTIGYVGVELTYGTVNGDVFTDFEVVLCIIMFTQ